MTKSKFKRPFRTPEEQAAIDARMTKARAARKHGGGAPEPALEKALDILLGDKPVLPAAEVDIPLDTFILREIHINPAILEFTTCWQLPQSGIALPRCTMDEADVALRKAQMRYRNIEVEQVFAHAGDLGDIIAALPIIRAMGGGKIVITPRPNLPMMGRESMEGARYEAIKPLLEAQPYITSVEWGEAPPGCVDFRAFRQGIPGGENLIVTQARHVGCEDFSFGKWLHVPDPIPGPAVFARSPRYWNPRMNWSVMYAKHQDAVFVGSEEEHAAFQKETKITLPHRKTRDLLELARVIAGSERLFCNQSCPVWIGFGLEHPLVLEVCPEAAIQNSVIENPKFFFIGNQNQAGRGNWR